MDDIRNAMLVLAADREQALGEFAACWQDIVDCLAGGGKGLHELLDTVARRLAALPRRADIEEVKRVLLAGEIFVRRDEFSSQRVIETLAEKGIVVQRAPVLEWVQFIDYWNRHIEQHKLSMTERLEVWLRMLVMNRLEKRIKRSLAGSGFYRYEVSDIERVLEAGERFVDRSFGGETVLVIGRFLKDMLSDFHGLISIGPFACMPTRIIDSILTPESKRIPGRAPAGRDGTPGTTVVPFLSIETDGSPFPQTIEARLEAFCLQVQRTPNLATHAL
jgi:predicted nucleotide-binding protein (sugar kinase/HSP70/actin superfamily)